MPQFGYQVLGFGGGGSPPVLWKVHTFTSSGTFVVGASGGGDIEMMVYSAGGSGARGNDYGYYGGGGGGGACNSSTNSSLYVSSPTLPLTNDITGGGWITITVTNGYTYDVTIGAGQARNTGAYGSGTSMRTTIITDDSGSDVYATEWSGNYRWGGGGGSVNSTGHGGAGGGGGASGGGTSHNGGSGGGLTTSYRWGGNGAAGWNTVYGGGGGGCNGHASASVSTTSNTPGIGLSSTFRDGSTSVTYATGGYGGNSTNSSTADNDGDANTGDGGDGALYGQNDAGNGGSGIAILRYPSEGGVSASGGTETTIAQKW